MARWLFKADRGRGSVVVARARTYIQGSWELEVGMGGVEERNAQMKQKRGGNRRRRVTLTALSGVLHHREYTGYSAAKP